MGKDINEKQIYEFMDLLQKMQPEDIIGLFLMLKVEFLTDKIDKETKKAIPRDGADCLEEAIVVFGQMPRAKRRLIIRSMRKAAKGAK